MSQKGGIHGNPGSRNHPKGDLSPGAWRMEGPEARVTWNLQFPSGPKHQAPNSEGDKEWHTPDKADGHLILQVGDSKGTLEQKQEAGTKRHSR